MSISKIRLFACGALASTLGYRILRSHEAKKVYTFLTSAVLREKDAIMKELTDIREDCSDIYADAIERNEAIAKEREKIIESRSVTSV